MDIHIGDRVVCTTGVKGVLIKQYYPTACAQQTMIRTDDDRLYHAPTTMFTKAKNSTWRRQNDYR